MGINDVLGAIGDAVDKIGKWTSFAPAGMEQKPLVSLTDEGVKLNNPLATTGVTPEAKSVGVNAGLDTTMEGMRWLYSNGIAQPLSTAALMGKQGRRNNNDAFGFDADYFSSANWAKAWHAANHISPGQAFVLDPNEAERAINSPLLYYKPSDSYLPPGFKDLPEDQQQQILKEAGMPAVGNAYIENLRKESAFYKYSSGVLDFALRWFCWF